MAEKKRDVKKVKRIWKKSVWISQYGCGSYKLAGWLLAISFLIISILAPFASPFPDGLESVAKKLNFEKYAKDFPLKVPFPDYSLPVFGNKFLSTVISGTAGVLIVLILATGIGYLIVRTKKKVN